MAKANTKRMTAHVWRSTVHKWTLGGAAAAAGLNIISLAENADTVSGIAMFIISLAVFAVIFLIGLIVAWVKSGSMEKHIRTLEQNAPMPFDAEQLEPASTEKNIMLGKEWLVLDTGGHAIPLTRAEIAGADTVTPRKEGMQKLWARVMDKRGKSWACMYKAQEPDPLKRMLAWIGDAEDGPAEVTRTAPEPLPPGTCPHCTGPNDPGASVCQWCGSSMTAPVQTAAFAEPAATAAPAQPEVMRASIPEEPARTGKGVYIVIGILLVILAGLLWYMFGMN